MSLETSTTVPPTVTWSALDIAKALGSPPPTPEQQAIIEGPLESTLVVAGAGSGKTETMASRVLWLVANGLVRPDQILGLTFTRKAALELATRLTSKLRALDGVIDHEDLDIVGVAPVVSTYHAYAGRLVSEHGLRKGIEPGSRLLSEAASWQLAHEVVHSYTGEMSQVTGADSTIVEAVLRLSGEMAEHLQDAESIMEWLSSAADQLAAVPPGKTDKSLGQKKSAEMIGKRQVLPLIQAFARLKRERVSLDFADQVAIAAELARDVSAVGEAERTRYRVVLLDEFQDTSEAQMVLLKNLFAGHDVPVTAVGDPHQSIYGWRGASATTLSRFPQVFSNDGRYAKVLPLSISWRNDSAVLAAANHIAAPLVAQSRIEVPTLRASPMAGQGHVAVAKVSDHLAEADAIADWISERFAGRDANNPVSAAVLCRKRSQFDRVVLALRARNLPVEVVGLGGLLNRPELVDLVGLLWAVQNPGRGDQIIRLLSGPVTRLGAADLEVLWAWANHLVDGHDEPATLGEAIDAPPPTGWVSPSGRSMTDSGLTRVRELSAVVRRVRAAVGLPLPDLIIEAERALGLDIEVAADPGITVAGGETWARAHLDALTDVAAQFAGAAERPTLGGFLDWLEAARKHERGLEAVEMPELAEVAVAAGSVQVLTVHAAKGLEWDYVAIPGLTEGVFPSLRGIGKFEGGEWGYLAHADKGWLSGYAALPFSLRGDRDGLPQLDWSDAQDTAELGQAFKQFGIDGRDHKLAEERRLAYVAFTRAKHQLFLTTPVWMDGKAPRKPGQFITELTGDDPQVGPVTHPPIDIVGWAETPQEEDAQNPLDAIENEAEWPVEPSARRRSVAEVSQAIREVRALRPDQPSIGVFAPTDHPDSEHAQMLIAERQALREANFAPASRPSHLSTSSVIRLLADREQFEREQRRPMPSAPAPQADLGTRFHAWVEQQYARAALVDLDELPGSADEVDANGMEKLQANFLASEWASRSPKDIEVAIETTVGGTPIRGRIDAVFPRPEGGFTVVDWKTGRPPVDADDLQTKALQLAIYRLAYARLQGLDEDQVDAAFFYASSGQTVRPELPSAAELESMLASERSTAG